MLDGGIGPVGVNFVGEFKVTRKFFDFPAITEATAGAFGVAEGALWVVAQYARAFPEAQQAPRCKWGIRRLVESAAFKGARGSASTHL